MQMWDINYFWQWKYVGVLENIFIHEGKLVYYNNKTMR